MEVGAVVRMVWFYGADLRYIGVEKGLYRCSRHDAEEEAERNIINR